MAAVVIYAIMCKPTGAVYVGSTKAKLSKRFREHRCLLENGRHKCEGMQADWTRYGKAQFVIYQLEALREFDGIETRREAELKWMRRFEHHNRLYNIHIISLRPTVEAIARGAANAHLKPGNRWTAEANEKRRQAQLGKPKGHGAKISATKKRLGQKPSLDAARAGGIAATDKRYGRS